MGTIVKKMREYGFFGTIKMAVYVANGILNKLMYNFCRLLPIRRDVIVFESESDFTDNTYALYHYMQKHGYMDKYEAVWLVDELNNFKRRKLKNTIFLNKQDIHFSPRRAYYLATAGRYIFDHNLMMAKYKRRKGQKIIFISHGSGFKMAKGSMGCDTNKYIDRMISTGKMACDYESAFWKYDVKRIADWGAPRNDVFFEDLTAVKKRVDKAFRFSDYKKVILWMPTFRKSKNAAISEEYDNSETCLPLFDTIAKLKQCNAFLKEQNSLLVLKVHHLSADLPIYKSKFSNILILNNHDISVLGIQLYEFVACTDALLTDYSSISTDYLLLDRPIIFTLDDYEQYVKSRGVYPANAKDYMSGPHVYTVDDLFAAFLDVIAGKDDYVEWRAEVRARYHTYHDGNSSQRIIDHLKL